MESTKTIDFLQKPKINVEKLNYILNTKKVYANLYEIKIKKELKLYKYSYSVTPKIDEADSRIRDKLFKAANKRIKSIFDDFFYSGDSIYSMKKVEEIKTVTCSLYLKGKTDYTIEIKKSEKNERTISQDNIHKDELSKNFIEMIIRDILRANPRLEFYKGLYVINDEKKKIDTKNVSITFYPGFTTSFMETESGNYLNVTIKNKIIQNETIYEYIQQYKNINNKNVQNEIKKNLKNRSFKVSYAKRNYRIDDILFENDRTPKNQTINYEGKTINLIKYYEIAHKLKIKDKDQPLILVRKTDSQGNPINLHFVPELCFLAGLEDDAVKDGYFMKELARYTKLEPNDRVNKTNEFLKLLSETKKESDEKLSSKEKCELYGIEVKPLNKLFNAYYMEETNLLGGNKKKVHSNDRTFPILKKKDMTNWLCFYEKSNYNDAENLYNNLSKASGAFGLKIKEPEWIEMPNRSTAQDWTDTADEYFGGKKNDYDFVVFLLGKNERIYPQLKKHSLCTNGYVSQVVKAKSLQKKGVMSVCSKILLQINAKLGGISYQASMDKAIKERKIMVVGVDSSHIKGKGTGVAMVATLNDSFTHFFNKEEIIKEDNNKEQLQYCVSQFIEYAIEAFKKEKENKGEEPKAIIIYRQGVSLQQKEYLKTEIQQIDFTCETKGILYYYILVNTKTTFKFFETSKNNYYNPGPGLLVIDEVTNKNYFEFYIQPQEVTQGSATPTCFHVAYGNLDFPEFIAKFTYDLCHLYANWQGTVRIPNVIKAAEKLSKMTAKYTYDKLNSKLEKGQAYL